MRPDDERDRSSVPALCGLRLPARYSSSLSGDIACTITDISLGCTIVEASVLPETDDEVDLAIPGIGLVRGHVASVFHDGFSLEYDEAGDQGERMMRFLAR